MAEAFVPLPLAVVHKSPWGWTMVKCCGKYNYTYALDNILLPHVLAAYHAERHIDRALTRAMARG
jgi:hypothetical protein